MPAHCRPFHLFEFVLAALSRRPRLRRRFRRAERSGSDLGFASFFLPPFVCHFSGVSPFSIFLPYMPGDKLSDLCQNTSFLLPRMNGPRAFCPGCKRDVVFTDTGNRRKCTACGFEFELSEPRAPDSEWMESAVMTVGHVLFRVFLIMGVLLLVGVAVAFASCALHF
jgi:uncharacterized protein (DUF983 family)